MPRTPTNKADFGRISNCVFPFPTALSTLSCGATPSILAVLCRASWLEDGVTGVGTTVSQAQLRAYANVGGVTIPNGRYRLDIGDRLIRGGLAEGEALGLFSGTAPNNPAG